jgi:hypothetical protein
MVVEANFIFSCFYSFFRYRLSASARMIQFFDDVQNSIHTCDVRVGAIICAEFLVDGPGLEDAREVFVGDAN